MPVVMLLLTAGLWIGYILLSSGAQTDIADTGNTGTQSTVDVIHEKDAATITYLSYKSKGNEELSFSYTGSKWTYSGDASYPLVNSYLDSMAAVVSYIGVYRTLDGGDTGVYGFEDPLLTFYAEYYDGSNCQYAVGNQNPMTGYLYLKDLQSGNVYTVDPAILPYFEYTLADMFAFDTLGGDIEKDYITSVSWDNGAQTMMEVSDDAQKEAIYSAYQALTPAVPADWSGTDEALSAYGIADGPSVTIEYRRAVTSADESGNEITTRVAASYTVRFGTPIDGKTPYILPGSQVIYCVDSATIDTLTQLYT